MALNVSYAQYNQGIDAQALKSAARQIFANADAKMMANQTVSSKQNLGVDLYNGQIDAMTARQVAMSGAGLQVTLNNNLSTALKFLKTKAAAETTSKVAENNVISITDLKKDKEGSNPFYNGELLNYGKSKKRDGEYLFITAA